MIINNKPTGIRVYLKTNFQLIQQRQATYGCGAIARNEFKVEVRIAQYTKNEAINTGDLLQVTGIPKEETGICFLFYKFRVDF